MIYKLVPPTQGQLSDSNSPPVPSTYSRSNCKRHIRCSLWSHLIVGPAWTHSGKIKKDSIRDWWGPSSLWGPIYEVEEIFLRVRRAPLSSYYCFLSFWRCRRNTYIKCLKERKDASLKRWGRHRTGCETERSFVWSASWGQRRIV